MSNLIYLGGAMAGSAVLCAVLWLRNRQPTSVQHGIDRFRRELHALAPSEEADEKRRRSG